MGTFSDGIANSALDALCRNTALAIAAVHVQLHTGAPGSAGTGNVAAWNTRTAATFGTAATGPAISNTAACTFTSAPAVETITAVTFWSASTSGTFLGSHTITSATLAIGDNLNFAIGELDLTISGDLSDTAAAAILNAIARNTSYSNAAMYVQLHTGAPGSAGTSNVAGNSTRQAITFGTAAASRAISNTAAPAWTAVGTAETYTYASVWSASTAGTYLGSDQLPGAGYAVTAVDDFSLPIGDIDLTIT